MDNKPFRSIEQQVRLLQGRGVATNEATPTILLREGYYAVVNGYGKPFIDAAKTAAAHDDRFCEGTTFDAIYQLFLFDRDLMALTFRSIMSVEGTLRSVLSHTFCEHHRADEAYLDKSCYTRARGYLRGEDRHPGDLEWLINTLRHHANGHLQPNPFEDSPEGEGTENARVSWYRENYNAVPLWVLFSDLTFGNLRYFFALMRFDEQIQVCERLAEVCGVTSDGDPLSPAELLHHLETLSDLRNDCAHVERIFDAGFGEDELGYQEVREVLALFLADDDERELQEGIDALVKNAQERQPTLTPILAANGF